MDWLQVVVLAVVQGITEFLPISSSAHLILVPHFAGWPDQGLAFDMAVHLGTLAAVVHYFRAELRALTNDFASSILQRVSVGDSRLAWGVAIGTLPAALAGLFLAPTIETTLRSPYIIPATTIGYGLLLGLADRIGRRAHCESSLTITHAFLIGCAQALALIPGTSRSGITMTAGLFLGLDRKAAARFSFLLSVPVTAMAVGYEAMKLVTRPEYVDWSMFFLGAVASAITGWLAIEFLLRFIQRIGMWPYVIYRVILGIVVLVFVV